MNEIHRLINELGDSDNILVSVDCGSDLKIHIEKWNGKQCVIVGKNCCKFFINGTAGLGIGEIILKKPLQGDGEFETEFIRENTDYALFEELIIFDVWESDRIYLKAISEKFYLSQNRKELLMYNYTVFENWLKENGGTAEINDTPADPYGNEIIAAYAERGNIESYAEFLKRYRKAVLSDTEFFLCLSDFRSVENSEGFEWDTFKKISLDSYDEDEDEEKKQIEKRWDDHLPILLGVGGEYFFYALELSPQPGKIVFGFEPEFEETSYCADSFEDFLNKLITGKIIVGYDCDPDEDF